MPKYSPQRPILKHPQPTFLPQFERSSFSPITKNKQNYNLEITSLNKIKGLVFDTENVFAVM